MAGPLEGIKVVEVANWLAAPSAGAMMRDLGAEVVKVEPPGGDVLRHFDMAAHGYDGYTFPVNSVFELDNRGKRSVTLALDRPGGPEVVHRLCAACDVLVLNLTPRRRERYRLTEEEVRKLQPQIVYASLTGYGTRGPDAQRPGFDYAAFWARSGVMASLGEPDGPPPLCRGGQGDHTAALNLLAAVLAALRLRDRTGEGQSVEVSLLGSGMWTVAGDLSAILHTRRQPERHDRAEPHNPIWNAYETADGRYLLLVMPAPDGYWRPFCEALEGGEWLADERYATAAGRKEHTCELTAAIAARFREQGLGHWAARLDAHGLIWAPVAEFPEVVDDPQAREMGAFHTVEHPRHGPYETLAVPFAIAGADIRPRGAAPAAGEHTEDVLGEHGFTAGEIAALRAAGVLG